MKFVCCVWTNRHANDIPQSGVFSNKQTEFLNVVDGIFSLSDTLWGKTEFPFTFMTSDLKAKIAHYLLLDDFPEI